MDKGWPFQQMVLEQLDIKEKKTDLTLSITSYKKANSK